MGVASEGRRSEFDSRNQKDIPGPKTVTFLAPDHLGQDPNNCYFEITLPHLGRGSIRMEPLLKSLNLGDMHMHRSLDLAGLANGLLENKGFFLVDSRHDIEPQEVYIPEGMGATLSNRWKNDDYIFISARPRGGETILHAILNTQGRCGSIDWLFNILLTRAEIVEKLGFNRQRNGKTEIPEGEKPDPWGDLAGTIWNDALRNHSRDGQRSGPCCGNSPMEQHWAIARARLPIADAFDFLMTPTSTLAMYSGLLK